MIAYWYDTGYKGYFKLRDPPVTSISIHLVYYNHLCAKEVLYNNPIILCLQYVVVSCTDDGLSR